MRKTQFAELGELVVPPAQAYAIYAIRPNMETGPWIAGGAVRQWFSGDDVHSDIDVYFRNKTQYAIVTGNLTKIGMVPSFNTKNAITYRFDNNKHAMFKSMPPVQTIEREFFRTSQAVLNSFDLAQCQLISDGYRVYGNVEWDNPEIIIENMKPDTILKRLTKYYAYGFNIRPGQLEELAKDEELCVDFMNVGVDY